MKIKLEIDKHDVELDYTTSVVTIESPSWIDSLPDGEGKLILEAALVRNIDRKLKNIGIYSPNMGLE